MFQWRNEDGYRKGTWDSLNEVLRDDVLEISEVRGGIWRDNVILEEDLTNATVMITARSNIDNWDPERSDRTKRAVRNILERWRKADYGAQSSHVGDDLLDCAAPAKLGASARAHRRVRS
jgi:hypothetical protein